MLCLAFISYTAHQPCTLPLCAPAYLLNRCCVLSHAEGGTPTLALLPSLRVLRLPAYTGRRPWLVEAILLALVVPRAGSVVPACAPVTTAGATVPPGVGTDGESRAGKMPDRSADARAFTRCKAEGIAGDRASDGGAGASSGDAGVARLEVLELPLDVAPATWMALLPSSLRALGLQWVTRAKTCPLPALICFPKLPSALALLHARRFAVFLALPSPTTCRAGLRRGRIFAR